MKFFICKLTCNRMKIYLSGEESMVSQTEFLLSWCYDPYCRSGSKLFDNLDGVNSIKNTENTENARE